MTGSRLLVLVASVLAGTAVLLGVFGLVSNPILLVAATPFAAASYLLWSHGTGRLEARMRERTRFRRVDVDAGPFGRGDRQGASRQSASSRQPPDADRGRRSKTAAAARTLGVDPAADDATIRAAFREKAKAHHPDAPGGDVATFRRLQSAYEQLTSRE